MQIYVKIPEYANHFAHPSGVKRWWASLEVVILCSKVSDSRDTEDLARPCSESGSKDPGLPAES